MVAPLDMKFLFFHNCVPVVYLWIMTFVGDGVGVCGFVCSILINADGVSRVTCERRLSLMGLRGALWAPC